MTLNGHIQEPVDLCPVQRPAGVVVIQRPTMSFNPNTMQPQQGMEQTIQAVNAGFPHEWRYEAHEEENRTNHWYCVWCCEWRAAEDVPTQRADSHLTASDARESAPGSLRVVD